MIVGLTGGIGSGKSEVSRRFSKLGITIVDADEVAREVVEPGTAALLEIEKYFGNGILQKDGSLNRPALRNIIFSNPDEKKWLENLLHPLIRTTTIENLAKAVSSYAILSSPLLFETNQYQLINRALVVDADESLQISRASTRDNSSTDQIKHIMATQLTREARCAKADDIIFNNGNLQDLDAQVITLHEKYLFLSKAASVS